MAPEDGRMASEALTVTQKAFFAESGYLIGLQPVFDREQVRRMNQGLGELLKLLRPGEDAKEIREWHESSRGAEQLSMSMTLMTDWCVRSCRQGPL